jgi:acetyl-CoA carboxylase biotin carboxyl carrier protein
MKDKSAKKPKPSSSASSSVGSDMIDLQSVKDLTEFMKEQGLVELNFKQGGLELHLRRGEGAPVGAYQTVPMAPMANGVHNSPTSAAPVSTRSAPERGKNVHVVKSPFVGTFYRSPGPNQDNFVEEGKIVDAGDALCIVEAMKLMNEIECDVKGRIVKILVKNETPVEFGEALFELEVM